MGSFSLVHWIILGIVILLLFGGNRFSAMMGDVAKGLKSFKTGMADDDEEAKRRLEEQRRLNSHERPIDVVPNPRAEDPVAPPPPVDSQPR
ncbi:twin-arginine translocase TatA/TatE family subunit [uncultured Sphingomonas sp.]|uniref:twin-arginine translocase TatA/TatE family subunit n=1 Tax=uncultured Sphingomonas sp. TaxID=158754 RepID=UPI0025F69A82|nr:twin-arginine translocase TatA/TatE family subunit [uncultured Sphingomonas sp.]